jgi:hypothetical protein
MSKDRVAAYLSDPASSQILHRHNSAEESIETHITSALSKIDTFDAGTTNSKK